MPVCNGSRCWVSKQWVWIEKNVPANKFSQVWFDQTPRNLLRHAAAIWFYHAAFFFYFLFRSGVSLTKSAPSPNGWFKLPTTGSTQNWAGPFSFVCWTTTHSHWCRRKSTHVWKRWRQQNITCCVATRQWCWLTWHPRSWRKTWKRTHRKKVQHFFKHSLTSCCGMTKPPSLSLSLWVRVWLLLYVRLLSHWFLWFTGLLTFVWR